MVEAVDVNTFVRWSETLSADGADGVPRLTGGEERINKRRPRDEGLADEPGDGNTEQEDTVRRTTNPFPYSPRAASVLTLTRHPPLSVYCDAVVNSTNETLTDRSGLCAELHAQAGPDLHQECLSLEGCRTGEAKLTRGHRLKAKFVIHTVGPRYNVKYRTAAENALHGCYRSSLEAAREAHLKTVVFPVVYTERKGYPRDEAAHVALRTIRRFLDRWGSDTDRVVLCVQADADWEIYARLTPVYFPRSEEEALAAMKLLPDDIGNEIGEAVTDERRIKIGALPFHGQQPGSNSTGAPTSSSSSSSSSSTSVVGSGVGGSGASSSSTSTATSVISTTGGGFTSMRGDPDRERAERVSSGGLLGSGGSNGGLTAAQVAEAESERKYQRLLKRARTEDLSHLERLNIVRVTGTDPATGRPVVTVVGKNMPTAARGEAEMEGLLLLFIKVLDAVVEKEYTLVYVHTNFARANQPDYKWLRQFHQLFSRKYKKNLKKLYIVHPSWFVRAFFFFMTPFVSRKFWDKLVYVPRVFDMFDSLDRQAVDLPSEVFEYDADVNGSDYYVKK